MAGETDLALLIKGMTPILNKGDYIFATVKDISAIDRNDTICEFNEEEGVSVVIEKRKADELMLDYTFISTWITLKIHSSLDAIGLIALVSKVLAKNHISCNVIAGYYHDHIFVAKKDAIRAINVLTDLSNNHKQDEKIM